MILNTYGVLYSFCLVAGILGGLKLGHMVGRRHRLTEQEAGRGGALDGVVFALLGLLLAFSFSGAITSYASHRDLLTKEANDIAELYDKLALFPSEEQAPLRTLLHQYAKKRLEATQAEISSSVEQEALEHSQQILDQIWKGLVKYVQNSDNATIANQIVNAFSVMRGAPGDQLADQRNHVPGVVYGLIFTLAIMASLVAGYGMANRAKLPIIRIVIFSLAVGATMYTIIDLEFPRTGIFNATSTNTMLMEVIESMR